MNHSAGRFDSKALTPVLGPKMESQFADPFFGLVGPQAAATGKRAVRKQKHGPILNAVLAHGRDFARQAGPNLGFRKGPADEPRHRDVSPQQHCQSRIRPRPMPKSQAGGGQKIAWRRLYVHTCSSHSRPSRSVTYAREAARGSSFVILPRWPARQKLPKNFFSWMPWRTSTVRSTPPWCA